MIKNDLFLRALKGETLDRPPVWMMRQAGRYLPEFMEIKHKYDFFTRCQTPELASEITVQPIRRFGMDAAILFCDILVIPQAMNIEVEMKPNFGPYLPNPIRNQKDLDSVIIPDIQDSLGYVMDAIKATKEKLNDEIPLIGFDTEFGDDKIENIAVSIMKKEDIWFDDFVIKQIPELSREGEMRKAFVDVKEFSLGELEEDDLNLGKKKVKVSFILGKGSYATMVIKKLFAPETLIHPDA